MSGVNKAMLIGRLGKDPEVKQLDSGRTVAHFSVATNDSYRDRSTGERKDRTEWHRVVAWGRTAEVAGQCLTKGRHVCIEGRIQTRKWQDKSGQDRFTTEIVAHNIVFLDSKINAKTAGGFGDEMDDEDLGVGAPGDAPAFMCA